MLLVATHSGSFHADDVFAYSILSAAASGALTLLRSRDDVRLAAADVVFDVGGVFDPARHRYDHHMRDRPLRPDGVPFSSAGLVWQAFGAQAVRALRPDADAAQVAHICRIVDEGLIRDIDLVDNGTMVPQAGHLARLLETMNPTFTETGADEDAAFLAAAGLAATVLARACAHAHATALALETVAAAAQAAEDPRILVLETKVPWDDAVFDLDLDRVLYVVRPAGNGWTVSAVPPEKGSFAQRLPLPDAWAGLRDEALAAVTGVADATFCHPARFVCGARSRDGALALARNAAGASAQA